MKSLESLVLFSWICRLDFAHQLLTDDPESEERWGLPLSRDAAPDSISILSEPACPSEKSGAKVVHTRRRCVAVLSRCQGTNIPFEAYQLQLVPAQYMGVEDSMHDRSHVLKASKVSEGTIQAASFSDDPEEHSTIFLASASFHFDLEAPKNGKLSRATEYFQFC